MHMNSFYIHIGFKHGCQNLDLDPPILRFYNPIFQKWSGSFKDLYDCLGSVGLYDSNDSKNFWFLIIFFKLAKDSIGSKWKITSQ